MKIKANGLLLANRQAAHSENRERFAINAAAVATYPMCRGISCMVGMTVPTAGRRRNDDGGGTALNEYDYLFVHARHGQGRDGNYDRCQSLRKWIVTPAPTVNWMYGRHRRSLTPRSGNRIRGIRCRRCVCAHGVRMEHYLASALAAG
jgi:hypothetical protein